MLKGDIEGADPQELRASIGAMMRGFMLTQLLSVACQLGLADLMSDGPKGAEALAQVTKMHAPLLRRALRALRPMACSLKSNRTASP